MAEERDTQPGPWWLEMPNRACVLDYGTGTEAVSVAAEFITEEPSANGCTHLRFHIFPVSGTIAAPPAEVRLLAIVGGVSCVYVLRVVAGNAETLVLDAVPLAMTQRRLRAFPRTPYRLGPCTAVVHTPVRQWRGLVEFFVHDVSSHGVGFAVASAHRNRVQVGDYLRAPVTLPNGERSWLDGEIIWLTTDGRGGLLTRRAPQWHNERTASGTPIDLAFTYEARPFAR